MNSDYLEQAMLALDDDLIAFAARPAVKKRRRPLRVALVAACCAALMAITAVAAVQLWGFRVEHDGDRKIRLEVDFPAPENAPESLETVYLPQTLPGEGQLELVTGHPDSFVMNWQWQLEDGTVLNYHQYTFQLGAVRATYDQEDLIFEEDLLDTGLHQVTRYRQFRPDGQLYTVQLIWCDGSYIHMIYCGSRTFDDAAQIAMVNSLAPITREECDAALAAYPREKPGSRRLEMCLVPGVLPQGLEAFCIDDSYQFYWEVNDGRDYGMWFRQESLGRQSVLALHDDVFEDAIPQGTLQAGHRSVQIFAYPKGIPFRDYRWQEDGTWCMLRVDLELEKHPDGLAARVIESMTAVSPDQAKEAFDALHKTDNK